MTELLILLLVAHFIGDFYAQPLSWVNCRNKNHYKSKGLALHFLVHTLLYFIVTIITALPILQALTVVVIISTSHLITDLWKSYRKNILVYFLIDQLIHIIIICAVWAYVAGFSINQALLFGQSLLTTKNLIIASAYLLVCKPASILISIALKKHTDDLSTTNNDDINKPSSAKNSGLISAGAWIGYIERCLAVSFIFMGQFAGIGFLVATKTIFRFGDLTKNKDMKLTEYMMLGTLISYAIALFVGWHALNFYQMF